MKLKWFPALEGQSLLSDTVLVPNDSNTLIHHPCLSTQSPGFVIPPPPAYADEEYLEAQHQIISAMSLRLGGLCCEYTNIFPFSPLVKVSITFLISFQLPLFILYYLETPDIFPTFFFIDYAFYLMRGTLGTCSDAL